MWYSAHNGTDAHRLGFAYSSDGYEWTKSPGNPIIQDTNKGYAEPSVIKDGDTWRMWCIARPSDGIVYYEATGPFEFSSIQTAIDAASAGDTINVAAGTYMQNSGITVPEGVTLNLSPGATLKFAKADPVIGITVNGTLIADGTESEKITFTSNEATPVAGDWKGIWFGITATNSIIDNCIIEYVKNAVVLTADWSDTTKLTADKASPVAVTNNTIRNVTGRGVSFIGPGDVSGSSTPSQPKITGVLVQDNTFDNSSGAYSGGYLIGIQGCKDVQLLDNQIIGKAGATGTAGCPIFFGSCADGLIDNNVIDTWDEAIHIPCVWNTTISDNQFKNIYSDGGLSILVMHHAKLTITGNTMDSGKWAIADVESNGNSNVTITENNINVDGDGIWLKTTGSTYTIENNTISGSVSGIKIESCPLSQITITDNDIYGNTKGIHVTAGDADITVNYNNISGNTEYGILNEATTGTVDATLNWWGSVNGPEHASNTFNVDAQGDKVSNNVLFTPWLNSGVDSDTTTPGFQPVAGTSFAPVTIGDDGYSSIQAAVTAASDGDTINVAPGTYTEAILIEKPLSLIGAGAGETFIDLSGNPSGPTVVTIRNFNGNVTFSGFTVKTGPASTVVSHGIYISGLTGGTITISDNVIQCQRNAGEVGTAKDNFGLIAGYITATTPKLVFTGNTVYGGGGNPILIENWAGSTEITDNHLYNFGKAGSSDILFMMNHSGATNNQKQLISGNTFDMGWGATYDNNHRGSGISVVGSYGGGTTTSGFTDVEISNNTFVNLKPYRRGIVLWNDSDNGDGGNLANVVISGNTISSAASSTGQFGIRILGKATGTTITNNAISGVEEAIRIDSWESHYATGTVIHLNSLLGTIYGVNNLTSDVVDATNNWWGDISGPYHATLNSDGTGDAVSDNVDFNPWLGMTPVVALPEDGGTADISDDLSVVIPGGIDATDAAGNPISVIEVEVVETPPPPPSNSTVIGVAYDFGPDGAQFDPAITLIFYYEDNDVPAGVNEADLKIAYFDVATNQWQELPSVVDTVNNTITAYTTHFTIFRPMSMPPATVTRTVPVPYPETTVTITKSSTVTQTRTQTRTQTGVTVTQTQPPTTMTQLSTITQTAGGAVITQTQTQTQVSTAISTVPTTKITTSTITQTVTDRVTDWTLTAVLAVVGVLLGALIVAIVARRSQ